MRENGQQQHKSSTTSINFNLVGNHLQNVFKDYLAPAARLLGGEFRPAARGEKKDALAAGPKTDDSAGPNYFWDATLYFSPITFFLGSI